LGGRNVYKGGENDIARKIVLEKKILKRVAYGKAFSYRLIISNILKHRICGRR